MSKDLELIRKVRETLPSLESITYFNTGSIGPLPRNAIDAIAKIQIEELYDGRITKDAYKKKKKIKDNTRESIAKLFNGSIDEIALTHNATEGINHILSGIDWREGDEVITSDVEHAAILLPLFVIRHRFGVNIKFAKAGSRLVEDIKNNITSKTRIIAVSHVSYATGEILPLEEIIEAAHKNNIAVLVDGAQSAGVIPVDFKKLNVDFYSLPGQKWLCGPEGTGALYVSNNRVLEVSQVYSGLESVEYFDPTGSYKFLNEARHFETASSYLPAIGGLKASIQWLTGEIGTEWIFDRSRKLRELAWRELNSIDRVKVITPEDSAGLISFTVDGVTPREVVSALTKKGIIIRRIPDNNAVRISIGFFNTEDEIERFLREVSGLK